MANTAAKKITYDGKPVQVESAIRDGSGKVISSTYAPNFTVETTGSGNAVTAVSYANNKITATKGATYNNYTHPSPTRTNTTSTASPAHGGTVTVVDSVTSDTNGHVTGVNTKTITLPADNNTDKYVDQNNTTGNYDLPLLMGNHVASNTSNYNADTYHASNIYANPSTGKITSTLIDATQVGGMTKTYELQATGYKTILQMVDAATFWTTHSANSYVKAYIEYSTVAFGSAATVDARKGSWIVKVEYSGNDQGVWIESVGDSVGTGNGTLRYIGSFAPKNSSYCPQIAVALDNATNTKVYIRVTILSATAGWQLPASIGGNPGTTNYTRWYCEIGRYNYHWSNLKLAANITGSCDGRAGNTWDTILNDRYKYGEAVVGGSLVAIGVDGLAYKLRNTAKEFRLPLEGGRCTDTFAVNGNYGALNWSARGINLSELINATMQGTAFSVPTWAVGNTIYARGTLGSSGGFVSDGTLTNTMTTPTSGSYTYIPIGKVEKINSNAITYMSVYMMRVSAYTINTSGKLTHIDGKPIQDTTYTHPNSGAITGTYRSVTVNAQGHVTAGTNPTTLSGYGITDALPSNTSFATINGTSVKSGTAFTLQKPITISNSAPSGGSDGDIWIQYS